MGRLWCSAGFTPCKPHAQTKQKEQQVNPHIAFCAGQVGAGDKAFDLQVEARVNARNRRLHKGLQHQGRNERKHHGKPAQRTQRKHDRGLGITVSSVLVHLGGRHQHTGPARPEEHGKGRAKRHKENDGRHGLRGAGNGFYGHPLAYEHAKGRQHHGENADHGDNGRPGHYAVEAAHVFDIARTDALFNGADAHEQQALGYGVVNDDGRCRHHGCSGIDAHTGNDKPKVGDCGIRQNLFCITLADRKNTCGHKGKCAEQGHDGGHGGSRKGRSHAQQQVSARLDHGSRVQQGRNWRWRNHCAAQPTLERNLRRLCKGRQTEERKGQKNGRVLYVH